MYIIILNIAIVFTFAGTKTAILDISMNTKFCAFIQFTCIFFVNTCSWVLKITKFDLENCKYYYTVNIFTITVPRVLVQFLFFNSQL